MAFDLDKWRKANPFILVNVRSIGTACGRASSVDEARKLIEERGDTVIGVSGNQVLFSAPVYL